MENKKVTWRQCISKSLMVFGVLSLDAVSCLIAILLVEETALGANFRRPTVWYVEILAKILTISFWFIGISVYYKWIKKKEIIDRNSFKVDKSIIIPCILAVGVWFFLRIIEGGYSIPKFIQEYDNCFKVYGSEDALIISILQNIYYILEAILVGIMVILFQRAEEVRFKNFYFPWGAIGLGITCGAVRFFSHPEGALFAAIAAFAYGLVYVISKKRIMPLMLGLLMLFIL